tara:strand:+ start:489 stop:1160 length:672 start_codon:yes stop_codon:yes gene_type:complete
MNFACVCYGIKYKLEYVQKLYNMVQRHTTIPHKFYCFTDYVNPNQQLTGDIIIKQFPMFNLQGWWNKMQLFHPGILEGTTLYMDLDVVITDNIDCFFTHEPEADFVGMNDFNPDTKIFNSSVFRFEPEAMKDKLWQPFINDRERWLRYSGDQNVISEVILKHPETRSFPDSWTQSYKWYDRSGTRYHKGKWTFEHNGESLVTVFHGAPNPHESTMEWVKKAWI